MEALLKFTNNLGGYNFPILMFMLKALLVVFVVVSIVLFIYDKYIQRENQLLINYPLIGRMRYLFYALRDPMRQYFGDEKFYESFDKVRWVYDSAERKSAYASFSPGQPQKRRRVFSLMSQHLYVIESIGMHLSLIFQQKCQKIYQT